VAHDLRGQKRVLTGVERGRYYWPRVSRAVDQSSGAQHARWSTAEGRAGV